MTTELIYGIHSVRQALQYNPQALAAVYYREQDASSERIQPILNEAHSKRVKVVALPAADFKKHYGHLPQNQGCVAEFKAGAELKPLPETALYTLLDERSEQDDKPLLLVLDGVQDPQNLGACLRTADAAGVDAVIIPKDRAVGLTSTVIKVASGAAHTVPVTEVVNIRRCLQQLQKRGLWVVGTAGEADLHYTQIDYVRDGMVIAAGAEGSGLRQLTKRQCDFLATIPMHGQVSSLNVSVAVGVILFEARRQRDAGS